jgi:drug/metabolite transporter (DMT)-like permease
MSLIWGIPYLLIRVAIREFPPPTLVFARTLPAALILLPLAARRNELRALIPRWPWIVAFAAVELAIPWLFLTRAEQHLTSSTAGLLVASVPLIAGVVYRLSPHTDQLDLWRSIGLLIGFAGVAVLVGLDVGHSNHLALGEMGIVAVGYALGPLIVSRRLSDLPSLGVIGVAMALTALCYAPFALTRLPRHVDPRLVCPWRDCPSSALPLPSSSSLRSSPRWDRRGQRSSRIATRPSPSFLGVVVLGEPFTAGLASGSH